MITEIMEKLEKSIKKNITIDFLEKFKQQIYTENELNFFREVCTCYLRNELSKTLINYLNNIFTKTKFEFLNNIDYVKQNLKNKDTDEIRNIINLKIGDIIFCLSSNSVTVIYSYKIDEINRLIENTINKKSFSRREAD